MPDSSAPAFIATAHKAQGIFSAHAPKADGGQPAMGIVAARAKVGDALKTKKVDDPGVFQALAVVSGDIANNVQNYGAVSRIPAPATQNVRNDMYLASDAVKGLGKSKAFSADEQKTLKGYADGLNKGTRFIPIWVKICVALALGLGTMVGWKRIVVTVGEKIGKTHMTYGQGAAAEVTAAVTILAADTFGMPVSTTHVLSSGVAGAMAANGSGLQWATLRSIALAWVTTLPAAMAIAGLLYFIFRHMI